MKKYIYEEKNLELAKEKALYELGLSSDKIIINDITEKNGLLKKTVSIEVITIQDVISYIKSTLLEILDLMNIIFKVYWNSYIYK